MKRLLFLPIVALPLLLLSCEQTPTEPAPPEDWANPELVVIQGAPVTDLLQVGLRCRGGVTGFVKVQIFQFGIAVTGLETVSCKTKLKMQLPAAVPDFTLALVQFTLTGDFTTNCPSSTSYYSGFPPEKFACPANKPNWGVATLKYVRK